MSIKIEALTRLTAAEDNKLADKLDDVLRVLGDRHQELTDTLEGMESDYDSMERFDSNFFEDANEKKLVKAIPKVEAANKAMSDAAKSLKAASKAVTAALKALDGSVS